MGDITFLIQIKDINERMFECFIMALLAQSSVHVEFLFNRTSLSKENLNHLKYLSNYHPYNFYESSRNDLLKSIKTKYVCFIDYHDILYPHFSYTLIDFLDNTIEGNIAYGTSFLVKLNSDLIVQNKQRHMGAPFRFRKNNVYVNSCVFKTSFLQINHLKLGHLFFYKCALKSKPFYVEKDLSEKWVI